MYNLALRGVEFHVTSGCHTDRMSRSFWSAEPSSSLSIVRYKAVSSANSRIWERTASGSSFI